MSPDPPALRRIAVATAITATIAVAGPAAATPGDHDGLVPTEYADGTPIDYSPEQVDELLGLIDVTELALRAKFPETFASVAEANAALAEIGYSNFGVPAPGGYWHFINGLLVVDGEYVVPEHPESLVYQEEGGTLTLVSAMYISGVDEDVADLPEDIRWYPGWHGHPELCTNDTVGGFAGVTDPESPNCPPGSSQATTPVMFHVWIVDNGICDHRFGGIGVTGAHCEIHRSDDGHGGHDAGDHAT